MKHLALQNRSFRSLAYSLLAVIVVLLCVHVAGQAVFQFVQFPSAFTVDVIDRFNVDKELSVPTWFASFLALLVAFAAGAIALVEHGSARKVWWMLGAIFLLISLDETAALHELALQGLHIAAEFGEGQSFAQNAWLFLLPFIIGGAAYVIWCARKYLDKRTFIGLTLGLGLYFIGAVVIEFLSIQADKVSIEYRFIYTTIEEGLEFIGTWVVFYTMLLRLEIVHSDTIKKMLQR